MDAIAYVWILLTLKRGDNLNAINAPTQHHVCVGGARMYEVYKKEFGTLGEVVVAVSVHRLSSSILDRKLHEIIFI